MKPISIHALTDIRLLLSFPATATDDRMGEGTDLWNMSLTLDQLSERVQAIQHAEQALFIEEKIEDPYAAIMRAKLAEWREHTT